MNTFDLAKAHASSDGGCDTGMEPQAIHVIRTNGLDQLNLKRFLISQGIPSTFIEIDGRYEMLLVNGIVIMHEYRYDLIHNIPTDELGKITGAYHKGIGRGDRR